MTFEQHIEGVLHDLLAGHWSVAEAAKVIAEASQDFSAIADRNAKRRDENTGSARKGESGGSEGNRQ